MSTAPLLIQAGHWEGFRRDPLPGVHVSHLARCLAPLQIQDEILLRQTLAASAAKAALVDRLRQTLGLAPLANLTPTPAQASLAALDVASWESAVDACGLMYWSPMLARELRAPVLKALQDRFGPAWWHWVAAGRARPDQARTAQPTHAPATDSAWATAITGAGFAVLDAWTALQDDDLAAWLRVKQPAQRAGTPDNWPVDEALARALVQALTQHLGATA